MTSCTFPTPEVASGLWSVQRECDVIATPAQCYHVSEMIENNDDQILDFEKLESDIMKNVLDEDKTEYEEQKQVDIFFPSFNYSAPNRSPATSIKGKPGKLFAKSFLASEQKFQDKCSNRSNQKPKTMNYSTAATTTGTGIKINERRKLTQKKSFSKIFDVYSSREKQSSAKQNGKKLSKNQSNRVSPQQLALIRQAKPPVAITIARRQPSQQPTFTTTNNPMFRQKPALNVQHKMQSPFEETPRKSSKKEGFDFEPAKALTLSSVLSPVENMGQKETQITVGRAATQRRNLTLRQSTRCDQKKRKIGVKTFAQIVAAGPAAAPKAANRFCKY